MHQSVSEAAGMSPKGKAAAKGKAAPKGKAAQKGKGQAKGHADRVSLTAPLPSPDDDAREAGSEASPPCAKMRRTLNRWDTHEHVKQAIESKLPNVDETQLRTMVGQTTKLSPWEYIAQEVRSLRGTRKNLASQFWKNFWIEFKFTQKQFADLTSADDATGLPTIGDALLEAFIWPLADNPADRKIEPFTVTYLEYCDDVTLGEFKFMIQMSQPGPILKPYRSKAMLVAILKLAGKLQLDKRWPALWEKVGPDFDKVMEDESSSSNLALREQFVVGHKHELAALMPYECIQECEAAIKVKKDPPIVALQQVMRSLTGSLLYKEQGTKMNYSLYLLKIDQDLKCLEDNRYEEAEMVSFKSLIKARAAYVMQGVPMFTQKNTVIGYLFTGVSVSVSSANDEWAFRLAARIRTIAWSNKQLVKLPWEILLVGQDNRIDGTPETILFSDDELEKARNVRAAAMRIISGAGSTFKAWRQLLCGEDVKNELEKMDRFWKLDLKLIEGRAEIVAVEQVRSKALACFPTSQVFEGYNIETSINKLAAIMDEDLTKALSDDVQAELNTVQGVLQRISTGAGPQADEVAGMHEFYAMVIGRIEHLLQVQTTDDDNNVKKLSGRKAMDLLWGQLMQLDPAGRGLEDVAVFRRFAWMLSKEASNVVDGIVSRGIRKYRDSCVPAITDGPPSDDAPGAGGALVGLSSCPKGKAHLASSSELALPGHGSFGGGSSSSSSSGSKASDMIAAQKAKLMAMHRG